MCKLILINGELMVNIYQHLSIGCNVIHERHNIFDSIKRPWMDHKCNLDLIKINPIKMEIIYVILLFSFWNGERWTIFFIYYQLHIW